MYKRTLTSAFAGTIVLAFACARAGVPAALAAETLVDRHHLLYGGVIPHPTDAPFGTPGELYACLSCHEVDAVTNQFLIERDCLVCHEQNVDRHHLLYDEVIPDPTDAPYADPGETYTCLSCHEEDASSGENEFVVERNCLVCHEPELPEPPNQPPLAVDDSYGTMEGTNLNVPAPGVLGNDSDADGESFTATVVNDVSSGVLTLVPDGSFLYQPDLGFVGDDSFTYVVDDGVDYSNIATVTIQVTAPPNRPPTAMNDSYSTVEESILDVPAPGVLGNDADADGDPLTVSLASGASNGELTLLPDGSFLYMPAADFVGEDSFTYVANDGQVDSNVATVTIVVTPAPNEPPVAVDDSYSTLENGILNVPAPGVLGNDSDADGNSLTARLTRGVSNGTLNLFSDGSFMYMPASGFVGKDRFTYVANDSEDDSNVATVTIDVTEGGIKHILVDIMPGTEPNSINLTAQGVLPVLILGTADCDVMEIDVSSLLLEGQVAPLKASVKNGASGYKDLKLKFDSRAVNEVLAHLELGQTYEVGITGALMDGTPIAGSDSVVIVETWSSRGERERRNPDKSKN